MVERPEDSAGKMIRVVDDLRAALNLAGWKVEVEHGSGDWPALLCERGEDKIILALWPPEDD